jgi:[acyl-carrier-protein] S-malonyltransferase
MQHAGKVHPGGMAAVLGLTIEEVEKACEQSTLEVDGGVWVANDNCPGQIVISGDIDALTNVMERLPDLGARKVVRLAVSIPAHSPLMIPAQEQFARALSRTHFEEPQIATIGNGNALPLSTVDDVVKDLGAQLRVRVRWTESIRYMIDAGVDTFVEVGSGKVLTGLLKRIDRNVAGFALDAPETFGQLEGIQ